MPNQETEISNATTVSSVTAIYRPGVGPVYRAVVPIKVLHRLMRDSVIRYAPKYQRGFSKKHALDEDFSEGDYDLLLPLNDARLQIDAKRSEMMAVKYLMGFEDPPKKRLFSANVIWNARQGDDVELPNYDEESQKLTIYSVITVPDTGHRHFAYYLLGHWKSNPTQVPIEVDVDGTVVSQEKILDFLGRLDLDDFRQNSVYVEIFNLDSKLEGHLYDEFNADAKPPSRATALDLNPMKTPSRRFMDKLMNTSDIFQTEEIETRFNTIGSRSRKLTTNATIEAAIRPMSKDLAALEAEGTEALTDLIQFFDAFYIEWSHHYPEFAPGAKSDARINLRANSLASANIIFHPMFKLAYAIWKHFRTLGKDWRDNPYKEEWTAALARLAGTIEVDDPDNPGSQLRVRVMDKENPEWREILFVKRTDQQGNFTGYNLSNNFQSRSAAYSYLATKSELGWLLNAPN